MDKELTERTSLRSRLAIKATCTSCGRVVIPVRNVHLWVEPGRPGICSFICPGCRHFVSAPAGEEMVRLLLSVGPPLGQDDLHAFKMELESSDWLERLLGPEARPRKLATRTVRALRKLTAALSPGRSLAGERHRLLSS